MRNQLWLAWLLFSVLYPSPARAGCADPNLSAQIPAFQALQTSRINALLQFGEIHHLCFGVEDLDATLLTNATDIYIESGITIGAAIKLLLGSQRFFSVEVREGVIQINRATSDTHVQNIFDHVLPAFEARRGSLQETSNVLRMYLVSDLNPEITGFAGHYFSGDLKDQVGPFKEYNRSLRYLLKAILIQSKGGAWVSRISRTHRGNFKTAEKRRVWTFVEYGVPSSGYAGILGDIASDLENDAGEAPAAHATYGCMVSCDDALPWLTFNPFGIPFSATGPNSVQSRDCNDNRGWLKVQCLSGVIRTLPFTLCCVYQRIL